MESLSSIEITFVDFLFLSYYILAPILTTRKYVSRVSVSNSLNFSYIFIVNLKM